MRCTMGAEMVPPRSDDSGLDKTKLARRHPLDHNAFLLSEEPLRAPGKADPNPTSGDDDFAGISNETEESLGLSPEERTTFDTKDSPAK